MPWKYPPSQLLFCPFLNPQISNRSTFLPNRWDWIFFDPSSCTTLAPVAYQHTCTPNLKLHLFILFQWNENEWNPNVRQWRSDRKGGYKGKGTGLYKAYEKHMESRRRWECDNEEGDVSQIKGIFDIEVNLVSFNQKMLIVLGNVWTKKKKTTVLVRVWINHDLSTYGGWIVLFWCTGLIDFSQHFVFSRAHEK